MPKDYGHSEAEIIELETKLATLAESFSAMLVWLLKYCRDKKIPLREEELPRRMLSRIMATLSEIKDVEQPLSHNPVISDAILQGKRSDEDLTESLLGLCQTFGTGFRLSKVG
jgi:hypothetical protein